MPDRLRKGSAAGLSLLQQALLFGFVEIVSQQEVQRSTGKGSNEGVSGITPRPANIRKHSIGSIRPSKGGDHVRGRGEGVGESSILQSGCISCDDVDAVDEARETNTVKDLTLFLSVSWDLLPAMKIMFFFTYIGSAISRQVVADGHEDQPELAEGHHGEIALGSTPDIESLGQRNEDGGSHGA